MKKLVYILLFPSMLAASSVLNAQNYADGYLGLPGDNLNLFAVMKLFQESETLEDFERSLNDENSRINNLDLNGDNRIDYIRVLDNPEKNLHVIVLQVGINARENQDVAVFYVEREADNQVRIQLIGDEDLYGKNYIVEPNYTDYAGETPNPGYTGNTVVVEGQTVVVNRVTTYEVAAWPLVRFIYMPGYVVWHSPWYYGYYPHWWSPWRPYYWHYYYGYHSHWHNHYYGYYRHCDHYYYPQYHTHYYSSRRSYSPYVSKNISSGHYKNTYSRPETRRQGSELYARTVRTGGSQTATRTLGNTPVSRSSASTQVYKPAGSSDSRRLSSAGRSSAPSNKSTGATTGRQTSNPVSRQAAVKTETRQSTVKTETRQSTVKTETRQSNANTVTRQSTVKTETRKPASVSRGSSTSERKPAANTAGTRKQGSTETRKSPDTAQRSTSGRR